MNQALGKHIRLYLVDGSPIGIMTAEIMGWTGKVLSFPRVLLPDALKRPECGKTGLYFLTGFDEKQAPMLYIGESDDVSKRLKQHDGDDEKAFFEQVTLVVSKDENLTKSHVRYLENRLIDVARNNGISLLNGNQGSLVALPEAEQSDMEHIIQQLRILLPVLGLTFLQNRPQRKTTQATTLENNDNTEEAVTFELVYLNGQIRATAYEANGEFVLEKGSIVRNLDSEDYQNGFQDFEYFRNRFKSFKSLCASVEGKPLILKIAEDIPFKSPSGAANFVTGANYNGRKHWKVKDTGQSYGDWRQTQLEQAEPQPEWQEVTV
jgi:predicted GIY-YIG superfamily endonuclease